MRRRSEKNLWQVREISLSVPHLSQREKKNPKRAKGAKGASPRITGARIEGRSERTEIRL